MNKGLSFVSIAAVLSTLVAGCDQKKSDSPAPVKASELQPPRAPGGPAQGAATAANAMQAGGEAPAAAATGTATGTATSKPKKKIKGGEASCGEGTCG